MKKTYEKINFTSDENSVEFIKKLSKVIENYQNDGYQVDVQYGMSNAVITALVLAYREEE